MTKLHEKKEFREKPIDLLVGGTPCQSFSIAGLRKGMADPRGNLALVFLALLDAARPRWVVWENVPGVLSADEGRAFGSFIGGLAEIGYGVAWRVLDAQYFGVPQTRERVFVIGYLGNWRASTAVLFERKAFEGYSENEIQKLCRNRIQAVFHIGMSESTRREIQSRTAIRDLTPIEYERGQGLKDNWTLIPWKGKPKDDCPIGPRIKACGNSMAVPVIRWIGKRINLVEQINAGKEA